MAKRVLVIEPSGKQRELPATPGLAEMRELVGGYVERVRVLDRIENERFVYTSMFVHETGLMDSLSRNQTATAIYQRNVRAVYPASANPFKEARKQWERSLPENMTVIDGTPPEARDKDYENDPYICGTVILFEGFTCQEADDAICAAPEKAAQ